MAIITEKSPDAVAPSRDMVRRVAAHIAKTTDLARKALKKRLKAADAARAALKRRLAEAAAAFKNPALEFEETARVLILLAESPQKHARRQSEPKNTPAPELEKENL